MPREIKIEESWKKFLSSEWDAPYFAELTDFVRDRYSQTTVYPPGSKIFAAFDSTPVDEVKVVILGQDPYHGPGQANGLCFSVNEGTPLPPSLRNIFKEIGDDTMMAVYPSGDLSRWARQGVLLLNSILTVEDGKPGSHQGKGWELFTDNVIKYLSQRCEHLVFMLWGNYAIRKGAVIDSSRHLVIKSAHPSPLSAHHGFFGTHHFTLANHYLQEHGKTPIDWR